MANAATVAAAVPPPARRSGLLIALTLIAVAAAAVAVVFSLRGRGAGNKSGGQPGVQGAAPDAALLASAPPSTSPPPSGAAEAPVPTASPTAPTASPTASTSPAPSRSPGASPRPSRGPGDKSGNGDVDGDGTQPPVGSTENTAFDCVAASERVGDAVSAGRFKQTANLARRFFESDAVKSGACASARTSVRYSQCLALCMTGDATGLSACRRKLGRDAGGNGYLRKLQENCGFQP